MQHLPPSTTSTIDDADFAAATPGAPRQARVVSRRLAQVHSTTTPVSESSATTRPDSDGSFDALTDLFLGEVDRPSIVPPLPPTTESAPTTTSEIVPPPSRPVLRLRRDDDDVELLQATHHETRADEDTPENFEPFRTPLLGEPVVECVVLGNLPVLASAWASQYVREIASACGKPVTFVRVQSGFASVELVGQWAGTAAAQVIIERCESIDEAIRVAARTTDRWIVRIEASQTGLVMPRPLTRVLTLLTGTDEAARVAAYNAIQAVRPSMPSNADSGPMVRLAIMGTGDNAAATVGRVLAEAAQKELGRNVAFVTCSAKIASARSPATLFSGPVETDVVGVMQMLERAAGIAPPISDFAAADVFTQTPVQTAVLASTPISTIIEAPHEVATPRGLHNFSLDIAQSDEPRVVRPPADKPLPAAWAPSTSHARVSSLIPATFIETVAEPRVIHDTPLVSGPAVLSSVVTSLEDAPAPAPIASRSTVSSIAKPEPERESQVQPATPLRTDRTSEASATPSRAAPRSLVPHFAPEVLHSEASPTANERDESAQPTPMIHAQDTPTLSAHIPGLSKLAWGCPYAKDVEISVDSQGHLHLLSRVTASDDHGAMSSLMIAASWARSHATLIAQATGTPAMAPEPVLHLFTDRPKQALRLMDSGVRVHVLASVVVAGQTAWFCTELN